MCAGDRCQPIRYQLSGFFLLASLDQVLDVIRFSSSISCRDAAYCIECSCRAARCYAKSHRVRYWYSHLGPGRNSILLGAQKDEFPGVNLTLMLDHFEDLFALKLLRSVFQPVGQNRYEHLAAAIRFWRPVEPFTNCADRATNCVQERRRPAEDIAMVIDRRHILNRSSVMSNEVFVIKQHQGQASLSGKFLLRFQESVYASDGLLFHRVHAARAIRDKADFA